MDVEIQVEVALIRLTSDMKTKVKAGSDDFGFAILACIPMSSYYTVGSRPRAPAFGKANRMTARLPQSPPVLR